MDGLVNLSLNFLFLVTLAGNHKKVGHLWNLTGAKERLELVRADLLEEGSFDDAVMACEGVFHTASPVITETDSSKACYTNCEDHFHPAIMRLSFLSWNSDLRCHLVVGFNF